MHGAVFVSKNIKHKHFCMHQDKRITRANACNCSEQKINSDLKTSDSWISMPGEDIVWNASSGSTDKSKVMLTDESLPESVRSEF